MKIRIRALYTAIVPTLLVVASTYTTAQGQIRWRGEPAAQAAAPTADELRGRLDSVSTRPDGHHLLVRFDQPLTDHAKRRLSRAGIELLRPVGENAYFASVSKRRYEPGTVQATRELLDVQEIRPEWKQHPSLVAGQPPQYSLVPGPGNQPYQALYVVFHPDVALEPDARELVTGLGGRIPDTLESINAMVVELPLSSVDALIAADEVQWVEPPLPRMVVVNDSNRTAVQANLVQAAPYNLDGTGVTVLVYDGGTARASHDDFGGRLTVRDSSGLINHATHTSGTVGGDGTASGGTFTGMAPGVTIESYGFETNGTSIFLYTNPGDIESDYDDAINLFNADVANNSIGTNTETNGFPCNIQGDYGVTASLIDAIARGSLGSPFTIVWSAGNERQGTRCNLEGFGDYYSTAPPATAKNHISVGALNSNNESMTTFSSWGPTDDGRIKPDISAPGCQQGGDGGVTSTGSASDTSYSTLCGTSMSGPTVAGLCALLLEDYRSQFGGADPLSSTVKALLAHNAADHGNTGPDNQFGYGAVKIRNTIDQMRLGNFTEETIDEQGASFFYTVTVGAGQNLKLTMAWDDVPGTPNVLGSLVNDLDLRVFDPLGNQHFPWTLDPSAPGQPAVQNQDDHVNNIEQVFVPSAMTGQWLIEVHGYDVPSGPQVYSLVSSHALNVGPFVHIGFVNDLPTSLVPGVATTVTAHVFGMNDTIVGGSPTLHVRYAGGSFIDIPMSFIGADLYQADLPPPVCGATPEFYFSAQGTVSGLATNPTSVPATTFQADVEVVTVLVDDDFESDQGWTVQNVALGDGPWTRGTPAGDGGRNDPLVDYDGSGQCWLTDNVAGNSDVDGGPTQLISPTYDLSTANDPVVNYARWLGNDDLDGDSMVVELSNTGSGGPWSAVETVLNTSGWAKHSFRVADVLAPSANVVLRFSVSDNPNDSITEGALDALRIEDSDCTASLADCNNNGILDSDDISSGRSADSDMNGVPDECGSGTVEGVSTGEIPRFGLVTGSHTDTHAMDGAREGIQERDPAGRTRAVRSYLEHKWTYNVPAGSTQTFFVLAHHTANPEGDDFVFAYSTDDVTYTDLLTVTKTAPDAVYQSASLPASLSGTVFIRVLDTDRSQSFGNVIRDTIFVDHMFIRSEGVVPTPFGVTNLRRR